MSTQLASLRDLLERRFPGALPVVHRTAGAVSTGIEALDRVLPGGGFPRGHLVTWSPGGGATAAMRGACLEALGRGERAAWVDGAGLATGDTDWASVALFRPRGGMAALECAEELLRSGGFGLVVLAGARTDDTRRVRLSRAVKEGGGTLVALERNPFMASVRVRSRIDPEAYRWKPGPFGDPAEVAEVRVRATVSSLGWRKQTEFSLSLECHDLRLSLEPSLGDRRGASR